MQFSIGHQLERSRSYVKTNGTIRFLDLKNIYLGVKIIILSAFVRKLRSKKSFCIMVANVTRLRTSHVQLLKMSFNLLKSLNSSYFALKFGDSLSNRNRDMAQNVILQGCDLEGSRLSVKVKTFFIRPLPPTHRHSWSFIKILLPVFPLRCSDRWPKGGQEKKKERKKKRWQKHFDSCWLHVAQITPWRSGLT